jgi:hypothetical protein
MQLYSIQIIDFNPNLIDFNSNPWIEFKNIEWNSNPLNSIQFEEVR